jgi:hypothetical protein
MAEIHTDTGKSWWETLPGVLTALATLIGALSGAFIAYRQYSTPTIAPSTGTRYFVLESIDVPQGKGVESLHMIARVAVGSRTWIFPFPQESLFWPIGSPRSKESYLLPASTDEASVSFTVTFRPTGTTEARELIPTHSPSPLTIKAPASSQFTVYRIGCLTCAAFNPDFADPIAVMHFAITDKPP